LCKLNLILDQYFDKQIEFKMFNENHKISNKIMKKTKQQLSEWNTLKKRLLLLCLHDYLVVNESTLNYRKFRAIHLLLSEYSESISFQ